MSELSPQRRRARARKARLTQLGADTTAVDAELKEARASDYIAKLVAEWPPFTPQQQDRLVVLLRSGSHQDGAA